MHCALSPLELYGCFPRLTSCAAGISGRGNPHGAIDRARATEGPAAERLAPTVPIRFSTEQQLYRVRARSAPLRGANVLEAPRRQSVRQHLGLVRGLWTDGKRPLLAMNAGMFHEDRAPVGLYVEDGKTLVNADTSDGEGNFYMKPNGVFFIAGDRAGIMETTRFVKDKPKVDFATQSAPC
jgi:hypothetical protein